MKRPGKAHRVTRRDARIVAMQLLYQYDLNPNAPDAASRELLRRSLHFPRLEQFAWDLVHGTRSRLEEIDALIGQAAENWSLGRMSAIDRNIVRLAVYEITGSPDTPPKVALDEAVEIAKEFGGPDSAAFVNGVLDCVYRQQLGQAPVPPSTDPMPATENVNSRDPEDATEPTHNED